MSKSSIGRPVVYLGQIGFVAGEEVGRRGKMLLTLNLANGKCIKVDSKQVEFTDVARFAEPTNAVSLRGLNDHYGDVRRMSARW